jgi:hypothetical protein
MIGQYLSNTNESATIPILQKILELNKALVYHVLDGAFHFHVLAKGTRRDENSKLRPTEQVSSQ